MTSLRQILRPAPWLLAVAGALATIVLLYPGQYPFDSAYQLWQARSGHFNDVSPVAMTALWSGLLHLAHDPALLLGVNLAMFWTGIALCAAAISDRTWLRAVLVIVFGIAPLTLVEMAQLLSDAHLAAVMILASGLAARSVVTARRMPMWACLLLLVYAGCVRHNAVVAILPYGAMALLTLRPTCSRNWRGMTLGAVALGAISFVTGFALDRALAVERASVWPSIALWDLAAISVDRGTLLLPAFTHGAGLTVDELRRTGAFDPTSNTLLYQKAPSGVRDGLTDPYSGAERRVLGRAWIGAALGYPGAYVQHRLRTTWLLFGPHRGAIQGSAYFVARTAFRDNPPLPQPWARAAQARFYALANALRPGWLFAALPYLLSSALAFTLGWMRRDRPTAALALTLASSALLYVATFVVFAPGAELRYLTWPIIAGPLALAFALSGRASRHPSPVPAAGSRIDAIRVRRPGRAAGPASTALATIAMSLASLAGPPAHAADIATFGGATPEAAVVGIAGQWFAPRPLREAKGEALRYGLELDVLNLHARQARKFGYRNIAAVGVTPMLRVEWQAREWAPFIDAGVGVHLLSRTQLQGGPRFGTAFQFGEWIGAGLRFGADGAWEIGLRLAHMSNADIKRPNDGITFASLRAARHF